MRKICITNNSSINQRLKQVRLSVDLTQKKFSECIAISFNYLAEMELSKKPVNNRIIKLVSMEFSIDEHWLRTGEGTMVNNQANNRIAKLIRLFKSMNLQYQECALNQLNDLVDLYHSLK